jgi:RsiW-degrading membrane proteinase PrsW (M82 family)
MQYGGPGGLLARMESSVSGIPAPAGQRDGRLISSRNLWWWLLAAGAILWLVAEVITGVTGDDVLVPTVILLGSFLVPVSMVVLAVSRRREGHLTAEALIVGFVGGGTLGLLLAGLTEVYFLPSAHATFLTVGLIEETAKALILVGAGYRIQPRTVRDGIALGATVGAGFAAFESSGYAFQTFIRHADDRPIVEIAQTEVARAVLAPFGHITWTAILGGALFAASRTGAFRISAQVLWTFVGIVLLHAAWDASHGWSLWISQGLVGDGWSASWPNEEDWIGTPTNKELWVQTLAYNGLLLLNAVIGTFWLIRMWRSGAPAAEAAPA